MTSPLNAIVSLGSGSRDENSASPEKKSSRIARVAGWGLMLAAITIGLAFPLRLGRQLHRVGENCPSYDYVDYIAYCDLLHRGEADWLRMPLDTVIIGGSHCMMMPTLVRLGLIEFTDWNVQYEGALAVFFALLKTLILMSLLGRGLSGQARCVLFAVLSGLVFSLGHFESFQFGAAGMNQQLADLFFVAGLWCLVRQPKAWWLGMLAGGMGASWSYGSGVVSWPVYLLGLILLRQKNIKTYAVWLAGMVLSAVPYVWFRLAASSTRQMDLLGFPWRYWLKSLALPFFTVEEIAAADWTWKIVGGGGLVLACALGGLIFRQRRKIDQSRWASAAGVLAYSLATLWLIGSGRSDVSPWYSVHFGMFWVGLVGGAFLLGSPANAEGKPSLPRRWLAEGGWARLVAVGLIVLALIPANRTAAGKDFFLPSLSPAAMTALREYRTAPTTYTAFPYKIWRSNHEFSTRHAAMLERHGWAMFGKQRTHLLQGEYGLATVTLQEDFDVPAICWVKGRTAQPVSFAHHERLNVCLHPANALTWEMAVPDEAGLAVFHSAAALLPDSGTAPSEAPISRLSVTVGNSEPQVQWSASHRSDQSEWIPCELDLAAYAGQTIRLTFHADHSGKAGDACLLWEAPRIEMKLKDIPKPPPIKIRPANTDPARRPAFSERDQRLEVLHEAWAMAPELVRPAAKHPLRWQVQTGRAWLDYKSPLDISCREFSHFFIQCALSPPDAEFLAKWQEVWLFHIDPNPRNYITVILHGELAGETRQHEIHIPLIGDEQTHGYAVDLRKHEIDPNTKIVKVTLVATGGYAELRRELTLEEVRFLRR